jgi:hypothetical protein
LKLYCLTPLSISMSILLVEETTDLPQVPEKLYHIMLYQIHIAWVVFELTTLVMIGTDCIGSCVVIKNALTYYISLFGGPYDVLVLSMLCLCYIYRYLQKWFISYVWTLRN